jgi:hypothetical protein
VSNLVTTPAEYRRLAAFLRTRTWRDAIGSTDRYAEHERALRMATFLRRAKHMRTAKEMRACIEMALVVAEMPEDELVAILRADDLVRAAEYDRKAEEIEAQLTTASEIEAQAKAVAR